MFGLHASLPHDRHLIPLSRAIGDENHAIHNAAHDLLAIDDRRAWGVPELRDVLREQANAIPFDAAERRRLLGQEAMVFFLLFALLLQGFLPARFERPRDEPIFWFGQLILPLRSGDFLPYAFQSLTPLIVKTLAIALDVLDGSQAEFQRRWLQGAQHLARDEVVESRCRDAPARFRQLRHSAGVELVALVARSLVAGIPRVHVMAALAADDQTREQRLAPLRRTARTFERAVLPQLLLVRQVLFPRDVGGQSPLNQHRQFLVRNEPLPAFRNSRGGILLARAMQAVRIGSRVDRMPENRQDSRLGRCSPFQLADALAAKAAKAQA